MNVFKRISNTATVLTANLCCRQDVRRPRSASRPRAVGRHAGGLADVPRDGRAARGGELRLRQRDQEADQRNGSATARLQPLGGKCSTKGSRNKGYT